MRTVEDSVTMTKYILACEASVSLFLLSRVYNNLRCTRLTCPAVRLEVRWHCKRLKLVKGSSCVYRIDVRVRHGGAVKGIIAPLRHHPARAVLRLLEACSAAKIATQHGRE